MASARVRPPRLDRRRQGEYEPLARAAGAEPLRLEPAGKVRLNPLDAGAKGEGPPDTRRRQLLVTALCEGALGRPLAPAEHAACQEALDIVAAVHGRAPTLPQVVERGPDR